MHGAFAETGCGRGRFGRRGKTQREQRASGGRRDPTGRRRSGWQRLFLGNARLPGRATARPRGGVYCAESDRCEPFERFCKEYLTEPPSRAARVLPDGRVLLLPELIPSRLNALNVRSAGVLAGEVRSGRFVPAHALFLALPVSRFRCRISPDKTALTAYFAGEEITCGEALSGYCAVCADRYPAGFGKAVNGRLKNHCPKGLRIR